MTTPARSKTPKPPRGPNGGKRPGAGRPRNPAVKLRAEVRAQVDGTLNAGLPRYVANLETLADGGFEKVTTYQEPAGLIFIDTPLLMPDQRGKMQPVLDGRGRPVMTKTRAFPGLPADAMVTVRRTVELAEPDRLANEYLCDRALGKPRQAVELAGDVTGSIVVKFEADLERVYGAAATAAAAAIADERNVIDVESEPV